MSSRIAAISEWLDRLPDPAFAIDCDGQVTAWNTAIEKLTGVSRSDMLGKGNYEYALPFYGKRRPLLIDVALGKDASAHVAYPELVRHADEVIANTIEVRIRKDDVVLWARAVPLKDGRQSTVGAVEVIRDVTTLRRTEELLSAQCRLSAMMNAATAPEQGLTACLQYATQAFDMDLGLLYLCDHGLAKGRVLARVGAPASATDDSGCLPERVRCAISGDNSAIVVEGDAGSVTRVTIPLFFGQELVAYLCLQAHRHVDVSVAKRGIWGSIAIHLGMIVAKARAELELQRSETRYRVIVDSISDGLLVHNFDGKIIDVNENVCDILGCARDELIGASLFSFLREPMHFQSRLCLLGEGRCPLMELEMLHKANGVFPVEMSSKVTNREGSGVVHSFVRDITTRKQAERALRESEAQLSNALHLGRMGPWELDIASGIFKFSDSFYSVFRTTASEVGGYEMPIAEYARRFVHPEEAHKVEEEARKAIEADEPGMGRYLEHRMLYADGSVGHVAVRYFVVKDDGGRTVKTYGVNQDITERRQAEQALRDSEEKFAKAFQGAPLLMTISSLEDGTYLEVNRQFLAISGFSRAEVIGRTSVELGWISAEDRAALVRELQQRGRVSGMELFLQAKDGRRICCLYHGEVINVAGRDRLLSIAVDVTGRKAAEWALANEQAHKAAILASMADAVFTASGRGAILTCNQRALELLGYRSEDLLGRSLGTVFASGSDAVHGGLEKLSSVLKRGEIRDYDTVMRRRDGEVMPVSISCAFLKHDDGSPPDIVVVARDISIRKRLQDEQRSYAHRLEQEVAARTVEIRSSEERYRALFRNIDHALLTTDSGGFVRACNSAAERLFGGTEAGMIGRSAAEVTGCLACAEAAAGVRDGGTWVQEVSGHQADGRIFPMHMSVSAIRDEDGSLQGMIWVMTSLAERERLEAEARKAQDYAELILRESGPRGKLVGTGSGIRGVVRAVRDCAAAPSPVLVLGESGVGKEVVARAIHLNSPRADRPFVVVDCAAIQGSLLERELFGHRKGAFTGATESRRGLVEVADGGTLFVDEIGEMPLELQPKLLRVLERGEFRPIGSTEERKVDIRVLAATNQDLAQCVKKKTFRADLFYRLNVLKVEIPPLRERKEDIPQLVQHFLENCRVTVLCKKKISREALSQLEAYNWPGNVRELANVIERAIIVSGKETTIRPGHLPLEVAQVRPGASRTPDSVRTLEQMEREAIVHALAAADGNKSKAAVALGISRSTLHLKMEKYGLGE